MVPEHLPTSQVGSSLDAIASSCESTSARGVPTLGRTRWTSNSSMYGNDAMAPPSVYFESMYGEEACPRIRQRQSQRPGTLFDGDERGLKAPQLLRGQHAELMAIRIHHDL